MLPPDARPSRPARPPSFVEQRVADDARDIVEQAFNTILEKRRLRGENPTAHEAIRTQEGGVYTIIFRWQDGSISRNVEGMVRRDEELSQWKLSILVHAWGDKDGLPPTAPTPTNTIYRHFDPGMVGRILDVAYDRVFSWQPNNPSKQSLAIAGEEE